MCYKIIFSLFQNGMNYLAGVQCELECKLRLLRDVSNNMHYLNLGFSKEFPTQVNNVHRLLLCILRNMLFYLK